MQLRGKIWKDGKHWVISCPALLADTQGISKKNALAMMEDWVKTMIENPNIEVIAQLSGKDEFTLSFKDPLPIIGLMLKRLRTTSNLTLEEAKERLGAKSRNTYWQYETGAHEPTIGTLEKLFDAMDCDMEINLVRRRA